MPRFSLASWRAQRGHLSAGWILVLVVLWFATAIPMGILAYSIKSSLGWDVFHRTGMHALASCLKEQVGKVTE